MVANNRIGREQTLSIFLTGGCGSGMSAYFFWFHYFFFGKFPHVWAFPVPFPHALTSRLLQQPNQRHKWSVYSIEISIGKLNIWCCKPQASAFFECKTSVRKQRKVHENPKLWSLDLRYFHPRYLSADRLKDVSRRVDGCVDDLMFFLFLLEFQALKLRYFCKYMHQSGSCSDCVWGSFSLCW